MNILKMRKSEDFLLPNWGSAAMDSVRIQNTILFKLKQLSRLSVRWEDTCRMSLGNLTVSLSKKKVDDKILLDFCSGTGFPCQIILFVNTVYHLVAANIGAFARWQGMAADE